MHIDFTQLIRTVTQERLAGKSFLEISQICSIPDPDFIQCLFMWNNLREPIVWKRQQLSLELSRAEALHAAWWDDARSGDKEAAKITLKADALRMDLIEQLAEFPHDKFEEFQTMYIEDMEDVTKIGNQIRSQIDKYNELTKDMESPKD